MKQSRLCFTVKDTRGTDRKGNNEASIEEPRYADKVRLPEVNKKVIEPESTHSLLLPRTSSDHDKIQHHAPYPTKRFMTPESHEPINRSHLSQARSSKKQAHLPLRPTCQSSFIDLTEDDSDEKTFLSQRTALGPTTPPPSPIITEDASTSCAAVSNIPKTQEAEMTMTPGGNSGKPPPSTLPTPESSSTPTSSDGDGKPSRSIYLRHFEEALGTVMRTRPDYASLFTLEEQQVARRFESLGLSSRTLYVRLFQRKGPWFRIDSMMGYDEIGTATPLWLRNREAAAAAAAPSSSSTTTAETVGLVRDTLPQSPFVQEHGDQAQKGQQERGGNVAEASANEPPGAQPEVKALTLSRQELTALHWHIQSALQELIDAGFLSTLPTDGSCAGRNLEVTLAAVECCMKSPEVKTLLRKMGSGKMPNRSPRSKIRRSRSCDDYTAERSEPAAVSGGKKAMVKELRQRLTGQRTLWGTKLPLVREVGHLIFEAVRSLGVDLPLSGQVRGTGVPEEDGREQGKGRRQNQIHGVVLMTELPRMIFKRVLRLLYLTCDTAALSSGEVGAASVRGAGVSRAMSSWSPGLSAAFGKSRYAPYACNFRTRIFRGREDFLRWEAAVELRCALDRTIAELPRGWADAPEEAEGTDKEKGSGGGGAVLVSGEDKHITAEDDIEKRTGIVWGEQGNAEDGSKEESKAATAELEEYCSRFIVAEGRDTDCVRGRDVACESVSAAVAIALACSRCLRAQETRFSGAVGPGDLSGILQAASGASERVSDEAANEMLKVACHAADSSALTVSPSLSSCGLATDSPGGNMNIPRVPSPTRQLSTKQEEESKAVAVGISRDGAEGGGMQSGQELSSERSDGLPCFLLQLEAGWVLASAVWEGVVLLERARDYGRAVELLAQLLATRYTPHRRGRWWNRLSLDLAHCGRLGCALWAVEEGLRDPRVNGGDLLTLGKRRSMLTVRINKSAEAARSSDLAREADGGETGDNDDDDEIFEVPVAKQGRRSKRKRGHGQPRRPRPSKNTPASKISGNATTVDLAGPDKAGRAGDRKDIDRVSRGDVGHGCHGVAGAVGARLGDTREMPHVETVPVAAAVAGAPAPSPMEIQLKRSVLAELSEVSDLLRDESIGAVVLATTLATGEGDRPGEDRGEGDGVPEISVIGRRLNRQVGVKSRYVGYGDGAVCTVESLVLQHMSRGEEGSWAGWHCEGSPLRALWALLMWDLLFMDVPDVFQTPFQDAPLDLDFCPLFYLNRREAVDARLATIRAASPTGLLELVSTAWTANAYTVCRGIRWEATSVRFLQVVAAGLGGRALASTLAALSLNHKHFGGGLPDLLLMRAVRTPAALGTSSEDTIPDAVPGKGAEPSTEVSTPDGFIAWVGVDTGVFCEDKAMASEGIVRGDRSPLVRSEKGKDLPPPFERRDLDGLRIEVWLLEVKGPSDHLSDRQTAWLRILHQGGARVGVCHVSEGGGGSHAPRPSRTN